MAGPPRGGGGGAGAGGKHRGARQAGETKQAQAKARETWELRKKILAERERKKRRHRMNVAEANMSRMGQQPRVRACVVASPSPPPCAWLVPSLSLVVVKRRNV